MGGADTEDVLDLVEFLVHRCMAISSNKDDTVDILEEGSLPSWGESVTVLTTRITENFSILALASRKGIIAQVIRDPKLLKTEMREGNVDSGHGDQAWPLLTFVLLDRFAVLDDSCRRLYVRNEMGHVGLELVDVGDIEEEVGLGPLWQSAEDITLNVVEVEGWCRCSHVELFADNRWLESRMREPLYTRDNGSKRWRSATDGHGGMLLVESGPGRIYEDMACGAQVQVKWTRFQFNESTKNGR